jgi:hypothetical protein
MPRALWAKAPLALLRHPVGLLAVVCAAFLVGTGAAAGPLMNAGAESEALQSKLAQLTPLAAGLTIDRPLEPDRGDLAALSRADRRRRQAAVALGRSLPFVNPPILTTSSSARLAGPRFDQGNPLFVVPMARDGATAHVHRLSGSGKGVWLSSAIVTRAGGDVTFAPDVPTSSQREVTLPVAAVYRRLDDDLANPYWVNFTARIRTRNPDKPPPPSFAFMGAAQLYRLAHTVSGGELGNDYEYPLDGSAMTPGRAKEIDRAFQDVKRELAAHSALAASLGCADANRSCQVTSELSDAVQIARAGQSSLRPVIDLLGGFCVLVALGAALVAGLFTGRRRAAESRLSLVGGEPRPLFLTRAGIEAALPVIIGSAAGFATAVELVRLFTPQGSVDGSVVREAGARVGACVIASVLTVAAGTTLARGRIGGGSSASSRVARIPWEGLAIVAAVVSWLVLVSGGGLVRDPVAGSHPRLVVLLLPALVAAPLTGIAGRLLRSLVLRRVVVASASVFLALRRVAAARGLVIALTVTVSVGIASFAFATILRSSLVANVTEKAFVANGSDVQGVIDPTRSVPRSFRYPVTKVSEIFDAGTLPSGQPFEALIVDPASLGRVLEAHWPPDVRSAVRKLASAGARLPAISVGAGSGRQTVTLGGSLTDVHVVARLRAFPGMQPIQPLLVIPARALASPPAESLTYVWATGPPAQVQAALAASSLDPSYMTAVAGFSHSPDVQEITRTYGFLRIIALGLAFLSLIALMLYLSGRGRSQLVTSAFLRRMGMTQLSQAASVALESSVLVAIATVVGVGAALITAGAIIGRVDPLSQYSPAPVTEVPWLLLVGSAVVVIAAAGLVGAILTLSLPRSGVGEQLRVS